MLCIGFGRKLPLAFFKETGFGALECKGQDSSRGNGTQPVLIAVTIGLVYLVVIGNHALGPDGVQDFPYGMALAMLIKPLFHVKMLPEVKARIDAIWKESGLSQ